MLYQAYQTQSDLLSPLRAAARGALARHDGLARLAMAGPALQPLTAAWQLIARAGLTHSRPAFGIASVSLGGREVAVTEEAVTVRPFVTLLRFRKDGDLPQPRVLVVAPLSGHFATLLRGTVRTLLADHEVYLTDWHNARDVPLAEGAFGFDDYVEEVIRCLEAIGPGAHVLGVCQPCVQVLAAVAVMAAEGNAAQPRSMTLMAGPVDTRINPTEVNCLATGHSIEWFERKLIQRVPARHRGAGRAVYPGFLQLLAFMAMNPDRHVKAHLALYDHLARGEEEKAATIKAFYDEYFAVLDLSAEFFLETVRQVFQEALLARGELRFRGQRVEPARIRRTALLTVEGERDDICAPGQTLAAHDLCSGLRPYMKRHHLQAGSGHYGVFSGRRWETQVYPLVRNLMLSSE